MSSAPKTAIIVPWRDRGDPTRRRNFEHVTKTLADQGHTVVTASDGRINVADPFNRSAAYNRGVALAPRTSVFVFHEADILVPPAALATAIRLAADAPGLVVPFTLYRYLSPQGSAAVCAGRSDPADLAPERTMSYGRSTGAVNVVSRTTLKAVGGFDEQFQGWGFDDRAMTHAFHKVTGRATRFVRGPAHHLWHTPGWQAGREFAGGAARVDPHERAATIANEQRFRAYLAARTPERVRELTSGARV